MRLCHALLLVLLLCAASAPAAETPALPVRLRCAFADPVSGQRLDLLLDAPAVVLLRPGDAVRASLADGTEVLPLRRFVLRTAGGKEESFAPASGAREAEIRASGTPGDWVEADLSSTAGDGAGRRGILLCLSLRTASADGPAASPTLRVGSEILGRYGDPLASGVRKVYYHAAVYAPPRLFARIEPGRESYRLTPHLRLGEMVIQGEESAATPLPLFPARYDAWLEFERLLAAFRARRLPVASLRLLSHFRAPDYNRKVGSSTFSRHVYGDAFDLFFDGDGDGAMDDLTGDGRVTLEDGLAVIEAVEAAQAAGRLALGGIGIYDFPWGTNKHRQTFHIDFRGHRATWAYQYDRRGRGKEFEWKSVWFTPEGELRAAPASAAADAPLQQALDQNR